MRTTSTFALILSSLSLVVACGGGSGDDVQAIDAAPPIDGPAVTCTVSTTSFGDKGALTGNSTYRATATAGVGDIRALLPLEAAAPSDLLIVEFYTGFAPFGTSAAPTAVVPATYQLTGSQLQYADCGVCVRMGTNATTTGYDDDYMATGGSVTVTEAGTAVGGNITFSVANLTFEHVTIDETTFQSTPVNDGCNTAVTAATHTSVMATPPAKPRTPVASFAIKMPRAL